MSELSNGGVASCSLSSPKPALVLAPSIRRALLGAVAYIYQSAFRPLESIRFNVPRPFTSTSYAPVYTPKIWILPPLFLSNTTVTLPAPSHENRPTQTSGEVPSPVIWKTDTPLNDPIENGDPVFVPAKRHHKKLIC